MAPAKIRKCAIPGCDVSLEGKHPLAKTCSSAHKQQLARIRKAEEKRRARKRAAEKRTGLEELAQQVAGGNETTEVARDVLREELRKYISREALTEDVLHDIAQMIRFAPAAIEVLATQLVSNDETVAQRAAALILKFTMGNPSVAPANQEAQAQPLAVHFNLPERVDQPLIDSGISDTRTCSDCHLTKPHDEFVGNSETCQTCFAERQRRIQERFIKTDETRPDDHTA